MGTKTKRMIDITEVAARMTLATLNMRMWRVQRQHRAETRAENERHGVDNAATVYVKLSDHPALRELSTVQGKAYDEHARLTLPSIQEGMRLLPAGRQFEHADKMREYSDQHNKLVATFLADYDNERAKAPERLKDLYEEAKWPHHKEIANKFEFRTRYLAMPTDGGWGEWLTASTEAAEAELRRRITETLTRVKERCRADSGLRVTVFDAVRELADLVPDLDFTGSYAPVVQALQPLAKLHAEDLRGSLKGREATAQKAADILSVLGGIK